ncbi:hypothetical protein NECAME_05478 [Necator americanus]|uniref:Uncharacterized protein n=1 Tax=Necator americanus TaxID=51031 RepID=W2SGV5_NECAM|nr:hypothetical protein NECAME_05478 [Necator americanus]ETN68753.1 hypothetical protein NECAME_05478 [Necator americanus]
MDVSGVIPASNDENGEYDRALGRFMRNEIDYDEFMRLTGGQTIEEEMAADGAGDSIEDDIEEELEYATTDEMQTHPVKSEFSSRAGKDLPVHVRNLMQEIVNDELGACRADALLIPAPMETDESQPSTSQSGAVDSSTERERIPRKLSKTMDALLGHANVIYARGNTQEALTVLLEVCLPILYRQH